MNKIKLSALLSLTAFSFYAQQTFTTFQNANLVIGQVSFTVNSGLTNQNTLFGTTSSAISSKGVLACGSQSARRVLIWNSVPTVNGANADVVIGAPTFTVAGTGCFQNSTMATEGIGFSPDGNKLIVADAGNNRVLIWNSIPTVNGQNADVVIGQTNFTTSTIGLAADKFNYPTGILVTPSGQLLISDYNNRRVLIFNTIPTANGASADVVIGQSTFTTNTAGITANGLSSPWYLTLSPSGKLIFTDTGNHRTMVYNSIPTTNGAAANVVIGQPNFTSATSGTTAGLSNFPVGVSCGPDGKLAIAEFGNNRVMIYNTIPAVNGATADIVLGQPSFTTGTAFNGGITAQSMQAPYGLWFDLNGRLLVNGRDMNRVLVFGSVPTQTAELALSLSSNASNLCTGSSVTFTVSVLNNGPSTASNVIINTALPSGFSLTSSSASAGSYTSASGFWNIPSIANGSVASLVLNGTVSASNQTLSTYANITNSEQYDNILNNNGVSATTTVIAAAPPSGGALTSNTLACAGSSYTFAVSSVTNATAYSWSASNGTVTGTGTLVTVLFGSSNSNVSVVPSNSSCPGSAIVQNVTVTPTPTVLANSSSSLICVGQSATLTAGGASTYSWNTSSTSSVIAVSPTTTTTYTVLGSSNGCNASTAITQSVSACTGIEGNLFSENVLTVYPNPSNGVFTINSTADLDFDIINSVGQVVKSVSLSGVNNQTTVLELTSGIYFLVSKNNNVAIKQKIVVAK